MATATLDLAQWRDFQRDLTQFARRDQDRIIYRAAEEVGVTFDDFVKNRLPPAPRPLKVSKYWTAKQRAWWWATMRAKADGKSNALPGWTARWQRIGGKRVLVISGHYRRTGLLVRSLDFDVQQTGLVTTVRYGTNVTYAKWVIDLDNPQSKYHQGNWPTLQDLLQQAAPLLRQTFADVIGDEIRKTLRGTV